MKDKLAIIFLILIGLFFYSLTLKGVIGNPKPSDFKGKLDQNVQPLELSPERGRFANTLALAERHTYDLGEQLAAAVFPDVGTFNGKYFSFFAPGLSYLALPFYLIGRHYGLSLAGTFGFVALISIFNLLMIFWIARKVLSLPTWSCLLAALIYGFATTSWSYAITLYQHQFTVFFMLSGFFAVWKYRQSSPLLRPAFAEAMADKQGYIGQEGFEGQILPRPSPLNWLYAAWAWLAYGLAISIDYPNALLMLPVIVYLLIVSVDFKKVTEGIKISLRPALVLTAIVLIGMGGLNAYHNQRYFGNWKRLAGQLPQAQVSAGQGKIISQDSNAAVAELSAKSGLAGFFREVNIPISFYTLTVSPDRGLFFFAPIMLLGLLGIWKIRSKITLELGILLALLATNIFLYSSWGDPWGGWAFGPRYLIPSMAVLSLLAALWLADKNIWKRLAAFMLIAYSSGVAVLGAVTSNAVPPKIEAVDLPLKYYNYFYNLYLLKRNESGSLIYNVFFSHKYSLGEFAVAVYAILMLIFFITLFAMPRMANRKNYSN